MSIRSFMILLLAATLFLSGCGERTGSGSASPAQSGASEPAVQDTAPGSDGASQNAEDTNLNIAADQPTTYIDRLVEETVAQFTQPDMSEFDRAKAAFDYMIETTTLLDPVGLELWRIRGDYSEPPDFVENRSLSVLLFHMGKCEDYAAALTMLLRGMGLEAEYVPGLTYSSQGALVDHAWTVVKVDGVWYHLDCQLEQNISRHGSIRYKYFMRGDATMSSSHRWGQNLIDSRLLRAEQNQEIAAGYIPPACPQDYPTPERRSLTLPDTPNVTAIEAAVEAEFQAYEQANGLLEPLESNIIPPVFALEGYGPQD